MWLPLALAGSILRSHDRSVRRRADLRRGLPVLLCSAGGQGELARHGDLVGRLAARGCQVTGLDSSAVFLDRARADAAAAGVSVEYVAGDMLVDRYRLDALTGRLEAERTVIRGGRTRRVNFVKRLFGFPELRDWLLAAGFGKVSGYGQDGRPLTSDHERMVIVANRP